MRVCLVYDCLFPWTVGGHERWFRHLAERLAGEGHEVTFLTRRQWDAEDEPSIPGVCVVAVSPREELYGVDGRRRIAEAVRFGAGVTAHLARHRRRYDVVHVCSFPYFSLLGARMALTRSRATLFTDWIEVWSAAYWRDYAGGATSLIARLVQWLCIRASPRAFVFSGLNARRLREHGMRGPVVRLPGLYTGPTAGEAPAGERDPVVLFAGRHIAEKGVDAIVPALALARRDDPALRALVLGDGPERPALLAAVKEAGLADVISAPGFVDAAELRAAMRTAACLLLPSRREGYGMVVIEAAAVGTPSVVVAAPDNAAVELVEDGVNGIVAPSAGAEDLARALLRVRALGEGLRRSTAEWFEQHAGDLTADRSADEVLAAYRESARS